MASRMRRPRRLPTVKEMVGQFFAEYARRLRADSPRARRRIERSASTIFPYTPPWERQKRR